ncbi:hypothetical protein Q9966_001036 [Columba livia]|nr:hypothetical protein Q9966_001036 [Columba livia]
MSALSGDGATRSLPCWLCPWVEGLVPEASPCRRHCPWYRTQGRSLGLCSICSGSWSCLQRHRHRLDTAWWHRCCFLLDAKQRNTEHPWAFHLLAMPCKTMQQDLAARPPPPGIHIWFSSLPSPPPSLPVLDQPRSWHSYSFNSPVTAREQSM